MLKGDKDTLEGNVQALRGVKQTFKCDRMR